MAAEIHQRFFALWPDEACRVALAASASSLRLRLQPGGSWINPQHYHLVLHVLDDSTAVTDALVERAQRAAAAVRSPPFALRIDQAGSFRNRSIPWWLGPTATPPELPQLWRELREALQGQAVRYDTKLRLAPHLTVLREADTALPITRVPPVDWAVDSFSLIHCVLGPQPAYHRLGSWSLVTPEPGKSGSVQRDLWENDGP